MKHQQLSVKAHGKLKRFIPSNMATAINTSDTRLLSLDAQTLDVLLKNATPIEKRQITKMKKANL